MAKKRKLDCAKVESVAEVKDQVKDSENSGNQASVEEGAGRVKETIKAKEHRKVVEMEKSDPDSGKSVFRVA